MKLKAQEKIVNQYSSGKLAHIKQSISTNLAVPILLKMNQMDGRVE